MVDEGNNHSKKSNEEELKYNKGDDEGNKEAMMKLAMPRSM
jgi:hypothetical protein